MPKSNAQELDKRGLGTLHTTSITKLCPNKKMPSGAPKTKAIQIMDAMRGALKLVLRYVREQEIFVETRPCRGPRRCSGAGTVCVFVRVRRRILKREARMGPGPLAVA